MANEHDMDARLSRAGRSRRERMRGELLREFKEVHRRRTRRRRVLVASILMVLLSGIWFVQYRSFSPSSTAPQQVHESPELEKTIDEHADVDPAPRIVRIDHSRPLRTEMIPAETSVVDRYRVDEHALRHVAFLSDEELVRALAAMGEPMSIVRLPDRVLLVKSRSREVKGD